VLTIERARKVTLDKPWGVVDAKPWSTRQATSADNGARTGEVWFERPDPASEAPVLLLKLLFTSQPLSIQVHPDDAYARSIGLPHGKTEAWYVLDAKADAKVALGLKAQHSEPQLRASIADGSIASLANWRAVKTGDIVSVPAGTIHAIGPGLVIAEIQQRSDATFRLYDHGRRRELHIENAVAAASAVPIEAPVRSFNPSPERTVLTSNRYFVFERLDLPPGSTWLLDAVRESWLLVVRGETAVGTHALEIGEAIFAQGDEVGIEAGREGVSCLLAYAAGNADSERLQRFARGNPSTARTFPRGVQRTPSSAQLANGDDSHMEPS
jgi:mannose-6-phosphate isomerase